MFSIPFLIPKLKIWIWKVCSHLFFAKFIYTILRKKLQCIQMPSLIHVRVQYFCYRSFQKWFFLFPFVVTSINNGVQYAFRGECNKLLSFLGVSVCKNTKRLSNTVLKKWFSVSLPHHGLIILLLLNRKWLLSTDNVIVIYPFLLFVLIFPMILTCLKSLIFMQKNNLSIVNKVLIKFKNSKCSFYHSDICLKSIILPFYFSIIFKNLWKSLTIWYQILS